MSRANDEGKKKVPITTVETTDEIDRERMGTASFIEPFAVREIKKLEPEKPIGKKAVVVSKQEMYGKLTTERLHAARVWLHNRPMAKGAKRPPVK